MTGISFIRDLLPGAISVLAVGISAFSVFKAGHYRRRDVHFDTVSQLYARFYELQDLKLQYPYLSHLFTTPDTYASVRQYVHDVLQLCDERERREFVMRERAVVSMLLTFHEQLIFQWQNARITERAFAQEVINYLEGRLLLNPRILWWWTAEGIGLSSGYEQVTKDRWSRYVLSGVDRSTSTWRDAEGPLPIRQQETD